MKQPWGLPGKSLSVARKIQNSTLEYDENERTKLGDILKSSINDFRKK